MPTTQTAQTSALAPDQPPGENCILVIFGASGDLTKRLLIPALYNLACDGLLPEHFAIIGSAMSEWTTEEFRDRMTSGVKEFKTRKDFNQEVWDKLCARLYYTPGKFDDESAFKKLHDLVTQLDSKYHVGGNVLFYLATPPWAFGLISGNLDKAGFKTMPGWKRIIVEKPFGTDLPSAINLNKEILSYWKENQVYRVDHYLGKETVQNVLAFRFANGMYEPLWNKQHVDHIQFTVSEAVSVEDRGGYYDGAGVLRDMMQNHMFQMLAYLCMEAPSSFSADDIRDEKSKLLRAVRVYKPEDVPVNSVRGQYGAGKKANGKECPDYRQEKDVKPDSNTETFAVMRLFIDNWRWDGVPIYLRSGKALWARGTNAIVQFKKPPASLFKSKAVSKLFSNRLIFHIQPDEAIETLFQAKIPGPVMQMQPVNMRFNYGEAFLASRATGYEVMLYSCMLGDPTLFSRTDLVETAWRIAQPFLDYWSTHAAPEFPNYAAGTWGPRSAHELIERDGRSWFEIITRETLQKVPIFEKGNALFLSQISMALAPMAVAKGETIFTKGEVANDMYLIFRGEVEVLDGNGKVIATLREGECFGEIALLTSEPRSATIRAKSACNLFVLGRADFCRILRDHPHFAQVITEMAQERYQKWVSPDQLLDPTSNR